MYIQYTNSVTFANCLSSSYDITQHKCGLITQYTEELLGIFDKQSFAMTAYNNHGKILGQIKNCCTFSQLFYK
jgi:hypothetical protein